jgi:uncharacterized protein (TIGR00251 family)
MHSRTSERPAADALPVTAGANGVTIAVRVIPRAARTKIDGVRNGALLVRLGAPPVDGAANDALIEVLADLLECPRRQVSLVSGQTSRDKRILITGLSADFVRTRLHSLF